MDREVVFSAVKFRGYKALRDFSLSLGDTNVLVGPNNSGKSTILSAFRFLTEALRRAHSRRPEMCECSMGRVAAYRVPSDSLGETLENVHTDFSDEDSQVAFQLSNDNTLTLVFPKAGGCLLVPRTADGTAIRGPGTFKQEFPVSVAVVPVLGPLESEEALVDEDTVRRNLYSHRASRHFRSFWYYNPDGFDRFAKLIATTWHGMEIEPAQRATSTSKRLVMFCREDRMTREVFWSGFGFQVWCQLLTHVARSSEHTLIVIDEPEIYLHPEVQRQLLGILRTSGPAVVLATHSTEIMSEADPADILLVDKKSKSARRLRSVEHVQAALDAVGSIQNITLTQLARNRHVLFVEGASDYVLLRKLAKRIGLDQLSTGVGLTAVEAGGFSGWTQLRALATGLEATLGTRLCIGAVFDRDYYPGEEIEEVRADLAQRVELIHFHSRKEIENYLLVPEALDRAIEAACRERERRTSSVVPTCPKSADLLLEITDGLKQRVLGQFIAKRTRFRKSAPQDDATVATETIAWVDARWPLLEERLKLVPGKEVLSALRERVQGVCGATLGDQRILDALRKGDIAHDLVQLLHKLDKFRTLNSLRLDKPTQANGANAAPAADRK